MKCCEEEGHLVLRTMLIKEVFRGKGLGTLMPHAFEPLVADRDCYYLPFDHLTQFYGQIGFMRIPAASAPRHLQERLDANLKKGDRMLVMQRPTRPFRS